MAGIRDSKIVDGVTYNYLTLDGKVVRQNWGSNVLDIIYDNSGLPYAFKNNGAYYIYVLNQQGDVVRIVNSTGATVAEYKYDAWGNLLVAESSLTAIGKINPIRYRGYYYDTETGFYYLQSRYYDPGTGRFINADSFASTGQDFLGYNMFAYCNNNPINALDPGGKAWYHWAIGAAVVLGFGALTLATCGGSLAAAATAVSLVSYGVSAGTTASTVAAAAFIGSATTYCATVVIAATESSSAQDFADQGNWYTAAAPLVSGVIAGYSVYTPSPSNTKDTYIAPQHTTGTKSPEKVSNPNGSYTQLDGKGNIYSYAQYDAKGRQSLRIDFQGRAHAGVIPHIHLYVYPERGGKVEYTFDLNWFLID